MGMVPRHPHGLNDHYWQRSMLFIGDVWCGASLLPSSARRSYEIDDEAGGFACLFKLLAAADRGFRFL